MTSAERTRPSTAEATASGDEAALMARIAGRDAAAFRMLVEAEALRLRRIAFRMVGDAVEAEDIAQETLLRLWQHAARWRPAGSSIAAWLTRVAINLCFDRLRRGRHTSDVEVPDTPDDTDGADVTIDAERLRMATIACVHALPERQRAAIVLTYYEELPNASAAEAMDMKIKGFESLLLRARAALRSHMLDHALIANAMGVGQ